MSKFRRIKFCWHTWTNWTGPVTEHEPFPAGPGIRTYQTRTCFKCHKIDVNELPVDSKDVRETEAEAEIESLEAEIESLEFELKYPYPED